mgnify:CR=1 FL=1
MTQDRSPSFERWAVDELPLAVEYSPAVMQDIRAAAVDGFYKIPHGGVEVGGVLFGERIPEGVRILAFRPIACQYATGPSFTLTEHDRAGLARLLETYTSEEGLRDLVPVGWYHSHTRSEVCLTESDLEIYNTYFPEPWQVSLVLRPERAAPVRAGFFAREPDGKVRAKSSYREFALAPEGRLKGSVQARSPQPPPPPRTETSAPPVRRTSRWVAWAVAALLLILGFFAGVVVTQIYWASGRRSPAVSQPPPAQSQLKPPEPEARLDPKPAPPTTPKAQANEDLERRNRELEEEVGRLRHEVRKLSNRNRDLEGAVKALRERIR